MWLVFFDSHSLLQRWKWTQELERLQAENAALVETIEQLEADLEEVESEEVVEKVAREQYGMRREGETVYRVEKQEP